ncbi:MAG: DUF89 family protein [Erysipelotrichaceae bacterium]|nr:DUF89 family protein [Erysipelotrichaceae bacterium]
MIVNETCAKCLYDKQCLTYDNKEYLKEIRKILNERTDRDTTAYLVYRFSLLQEKYFGKARSYKEEKKRYNDLVMSMETSLRKKIEGSADPLLQSLVYARIGNYIDFGTLSDVTEEKFLSLFADADASETDRRTYASFLKQCEDAEDLLLIADNCGEIVLDKLFLEELKERFPHLILRVLVRGGEAVNDVTPEDAEYVGIDKVATIVSNGMPISGTVYHLLSDEARDVLDHSDVVLSKGQANYESLSKQGRHIFYSFLCKCSLFTERFDLPLLSGVFVEESD